MKKKFFFIFLGTIIILLGGNYLKKEHDEKRLIEIEGPRIEKYLKYNYKDVSTVTFTKVIVNPTGIPHIKGYVNNNKKIGFNAGIYKEHYSASLNWDNDELAPDSIYPYKNKTVEEIEEEEEEAQKKN